MSQKYYSILTQIGANKLAAATANETTIKLTHIAVGDGNGSDTNPNASDTTLVHEVYRTEVNELKVDENNSNYVVVSSMIPPPDGNFWVREIGLFDEDGDLIAVGNKSATFKPILSDGEANELLLRIAIEVTNSDAVELVIDPSVVMASREFVNKELEKYALLNGDVNQPFKVKTAILDNEAVNKKQAETIAKENGGKLLPVLQYVERSAIVIASGSFVSTGIKQKITPSSSDHKVLIRIVVSVGCTGGATGMRGAIYKNGVLMDNAIGNENGNHPLATIHVGELATDHAQAQGVIEFLDTPSTTEEIEYELFARGHSASYPIKINSTLTDSNSATGTRTISSITLMEVK